MISAIGVVVSSLVAAPAAVGAAAALEARIMPEMLEHLNLSSRCASEGQWQRAVAHADVVLLPGKASYRIECGDAPKKEVRKFRDAVSQAVGLWETTSDGQVDFEESADAEILIVFQTEVVGKTGEVGGNVRWNRGIQVSSSGEPTPLLNATIHVRTRQPNGKLMNPSHLKHIVSHELGHILGLNDSLQIGQIMGPLDLARPARQLAPEEIRAVQHIRNLAIQRRRNGLLTALDSPEGYNLPRATR